MIKAIVYCSTPSLLSFFFFPSVLPSFLRSLFSSFHVSHSFLLFSYFFLCILVFCLSLLVYSFMFFLPSFILFFLSFSFPFSLLLSFYFLSYLLPPSLVIYFFPSFLASHLIFLSLPSFLRVLLQLILKHQNHQNWVRVFHTTAKRPFTL